MKYVLRKIWFFLAAVIILSAGGDVLYAQNPSSSFKNRHAHNSTTLSEQQSLRIKDSLMDIYKTSKSLSYKEKVTLLLNITDLSTDDSSMFRAARELYQLASSKGDADNKLEALVILCTEQQPDLEKYMRMAMQLPESHAASELVQYYRYRIEVNDVKNKNKEYRNQIIRSLMKRYSLNRYKDIYEKTGDLMILCKLLSYSTTGDLYGRYVSYMYKAGRSLPKDGDNILAFLYFHQCAVFYARQGMQKEALASDMQLLLIYNKLENFYKRTGRIYVSMNQYRYVSYRRMLSYDKVLSGVQLDSTLAIIKRLANTDSDIHNDLYDRSSSAFARYYFSKKEYKKAITYLDAALESNADSVQWRVPEMLMMRIRAGQALNDTSMHKYLLWYKDYLEETKKDGIEEKDKELDVIYDLSEVKQKSSEKLSVIIFISGLFVLFAILLTGRLLLRSKKAEASLQVSQKQLLAEKEIISETMADLKRAELQANKANKMKTMFLQNMSHEIRTPLNSIIGFSQLIAEGGKDMNNKDASTYVGMVSKNSKLLQTLISDVLDIARMESGELKFNYSDFSANDVCEDSIQIVVRNVQPGVKLSFVRHEDSVIVHSDLQRVQQVILNYLTNACKFTKSGSITLDYRADLPAGKITFSVTDTGIGIPVDKMDDVFNRFEKLNKFSQGTGLGLHICSLIAKGLHGTAAIDKSYKGGSRFIFDIPMV